MGLCQQDDLVVHRLELLHDARSRGLYERLQRDVAQVSPETEVKSVEVNLRDPWDFEEVYGALHDFAGGYDFEPEAEESGVAEEIKRLHQAWSGQAGSAVDVLLGDRAASLDLFDHLQLENVVRVCQQSASLSDAGRRLFSVSRQERAKPNDADRLRKYLARFSLDWPQLKSSPQ